MVSQQRRAQTYYSCQAYDEHACILNEEKTFDLLSKEASQSNTQSVIFHFFYHRRAQQAAPLREDGMFDQGTMQAHKIAMSQDVGE
ncbi:MAG TPA: hypothetical protein DDW49_06355 [Deltaproteobacteria bacterium]|nr:MAG: hypothetical protein A2048_02355 [Deltaproteobacteria bacterium GWA2_45_12]HBF12995.1 hypothetical protein [Deltaproteobacteria bacterium]